MTSEDEEKSKAKQKKLNEKGKEIIKLQKKIDEHRDRLWGKIESLTKDLPEYNRSLESKKESLEKKEKPSRSDKESLEKIKKLISFLNRFKKFYENELKPGLRNLKSFFKLYFYTWGVPKARNNFHLLKRALDIMSNLNEKGTLRLGKEITGTIDKIKEDLGILPRVMEKYLKLKKEYQKMWKELKKTK